MPKTSKSNVFCCVYGCNSKASRDNVSFHFFPKYNTGKVEVINKYGVSERVDIRTSWEKNLKCGKKVTNSMRVCSKHFEESDFYPQVKEVKLKKNVVPSKNLPKRTHERLETCKKERRCIMKHVARKQNVDTVCEELKMKEMSEEELEQQGTTTYTSSELSAAEALCALAEIKYKDVTVQVNTLKIRIVCDNITTDKKLNSLTGLNSFELLRSIERLVLKVKKENYVSFLSIKEKINLTFAKLKNDTSYVVLSLLFGNISSQSIKVIFL